MIGGSGRRPRALARLIAPFALSAVLLSGCANLDSGSSGGPGQRTNVDVTTPELQQLKATTDLPDCAPAPRSAASQSDTEETDGRLPGVTLDCLGGGTSVDLSSLKGPMVINLWASWCGPCRRELPMYQEFYERYGDKVAVLGIDFNDVRPSAALELARESKLTYPNLADPNTDLQARDGFPTIPGLPGMIFVDEQGRYEFDGSKHIELREVKSVDEIVELVEKHLKVKL